MALYSTGVASTPHPTQSTRLTRPVSRVHLLLSLADKIHCESVQLFVLISIYAFNIHKIHQKWTARVYMILFYNLQTMVVSPSSAQHCPVTIPVDVTSKPLLTAPQRCTPMTYILNHRHNRWRHHYLCTTVTTLTSYGGKHIRHTIENRFLLFFAAANFFNPSFLYMYVIYWFIYTIS